MQLQSHTAGSGGGTLTGPSRGQALSHQEEERGPAQMPLLLGLLGPCPRLTLPVLPRLVGQAVAPTC